MKKIKVYSTPTCPHCIMLKQYLDNKGIAYEACDVSADQEKAEEMIKKTNQRRVPVVSITNENNKEEIIIGFDQEKLDEALNE